MLRVLELLAKISQATGVSALLIGGQALQAYGVIRQTLDVDLLVAEGDADVLEEALRRAGYGVLVRSDIFGRYRHASPALPDVDVLYVDGHTAERMLQRSAEHHAAAAPYRVPALPHLVALKLHAIRNNPAREPRDFADIVELLRTNAGTVGRDELQALCAAHGPEGIWQRLEEVLWKRP
ncbi:MAG: nucleotidyl transferase AbiEii/AbiGii toxin family protein [Candidatus Methylomirabilota bacterium]